VIAVDIVWGVVTGLAAWLPSWLVGRRRRWAPALDVLALFAALFVYWKVLDPYPPRFTSRVLAFVVATFGAAGIGYLLRHRRSSSTLIA
jgi:hypothetical protein